MLRGPTIDVDGFFEVVSELGLTLRFREPHALRTVCYRFRRIIKKVKKQRRVARELAALEKWREYVHTEGRDLEDRCSEPASQR
jgi:hypothetical protein